MNKSVLLLTRGFALLTVSCNKDKITPIGYSYFLYSPDTLHIKPGESGEFSGLYNAEQISESTVVTSDVFPDVFLSARAFNQDDLGPTTSFQDTLDFPFFNEKVSGKYNFQYVITAMENCPENTFLFHIIHQTTYSDPNYRQDSYSVDTLYVTVSALGSGGGGGCRDNLTLDFSVNDDCAPTGFPITDGFCSAGAGANDLLLNMELFGTAQISATVDCNNNTLSIPMQIINTGTQNIDIDGSGTFNVTANGVTMDIMYNAKVSGSTDPPATCTSNWTSD
jgi:hypothetical protein